MTASKRPNRVWRQIFNAATYHSCEGCGGLMSGSLDALKTEWPTHQELITCDDCNMTVIAVTKDIRREDEPDYRWPTPEEREASIKATAEYRTEATEAEEVRP